MKPFYAVMLAGIIGLPAIANAGDRDINMGNATAADLAKLICERKITSEQVISYSLGKIASHPNLNAFITVEGDNALSQARKWDLYLKKGGRCLPLGGVPIAVKDNIEVAGLPTTAGTPALRHFIPDETAPVVQKVINAGAIIIGKTNMHELAYGATGYNAAYHVPGITGVRNAYDSSRVAGGSSSGSAVAVAANMVSAAIGTDTGASVRQPCALNGCVGFRPTTGRYPPSGIVPISSTRDTPGPMAHKVSDVALLDSVITGEKLLPAIPAGQIRLGIADYFWQGLDEDVSLQAHEALNRLKAAGVQIVKVSMPGLQKTAEAVSFPVVMYEGKRELIGYLQTRDTGVSFRALVASIASPDVKAIFETGIVPGIVRGPDGKLVPVRTLYQNALDKGIPHLLHIYQKAFKDNRLDAMIFPTSPIVAPLAVKGVSSPEMFSRLIHNTDPGSLIRLPGISIPVGKGKKSGMPVGLEIDALPENDAKLLAISASLEKIIND
ncbi:indoleacetamide hydrolase [Pantoea anthophila]|nr:indoleacetamide hydrolase [Pantoea anthophila]